MNLDARLARELIRLDPRRAAAALERLDVADAAGMLGAADADEAAPVLACVEPFAAATILERIPAPSAADLVGRLEQDAAARLVRRMDTPQRDALLTHLPPARARMLGTLLAFPEHTAGALMDPGVLALPDDLTVDEARRRMRDESDRAHYNVYVVDRAHQLVGVVNLRELLLAPAEAVLADIAVRDPFRLAADADRAAVVAHPGWRYVHSIPVVDERGCYLGAVRYRTLRQLEEELLGLDRRDADAAQVLGELFAAGASGLLHALGEAGGDRRGI